MLKKIFNCYINFLCMNLLMTVKVLFTSTVQHSAAIIAPVIEMSLALHGYEGACKIQATENPLTLRIELTPEEQMSKHEWDSLLNGLRNQFAGAVIVLE